MRGCGKEYSYPVMTDEGVTVTGSKGKAELVARTVISVLTTSVEKRRTRTIAKYGHILLGDAGSSKEEEIKCFIKDKGGVAAYVGL